MSGQPVAGGGQGAADLQVGPLRYLHYDVFTNRALEGNQLAVFLDGRGAAAERMQRIAREMNFSESTFVLPAELPGTDVRMRIFTPFNELPMAGHPTIGSTFALAQTGVIAPGAKRFVFGLGVGPVPVDLEWDGERLSFAWMTQLAPTFGPPVAQRAAVAHAIGLDERDLVADLPIQSVSCGVPFLLVPIRDNAAVDRAVPDTSAFKRLHEETGINLPVFLFAFTAPAAAHSRMFAPEFGIFEDPATGSACGPLGCYLVRRRLIDGDAAQRIVNMQGVAMGRPSRIHISITGTPDEIRVVKVGGEAVLVARGELLV
jgi:trans-2,3-dihydro-3-hydroxyanthranilate isomerase